MGRSLFQKPRATIIRPSRRAEYFEDDGDAWLRRRSLRDQPSEPRRMPPIVRLIGLLFAITTGVFVGAVIWLLVGAARS